MGAWGCQTKPSPRSFRNRRLRSEETQKELPRHGGLVNWGHAIYLRLFSDDQPNLVQAPAHGAERQKSAELCLAEGATL